MALRELFGGAITLNLPGKLIDASDLRQIPDNQEVLLGLEDNTTVIVEVLESVEAGRRSGNLEEAVRFHFSSLAHDNSASSSEVNEVITPSNRDKDGTDQTPAPIVLIGQQKIHKFGREKEPEDEVRIYLALWRLEPTKKVDLVMSFNEPLSVSSTTEESSKLREIFHKATQSLRICDWNLFAS